MGVLSPERPYVLLPLLAGQSQALAVIDSFYRAGALVFGGGHVVLPLLQAEVVQPGWVTPDTFLAGYGAAQAVPGPLFTLAAYLEAVLGPQPNGIAGATVALLAVFLPGFLLLVGVLHVWDRFRAMAPAQSMMKGQMRRSSASSARRCIHPSSPARSVTCATSRSRSSVSCC